MSENSNEGVERTEETVTEKVVQEPAADEGGPLGNVTQAVTTEEPTETVVERSEETVTERPAGDSSGSDSDES